MGLFTFIADLRAAGVIDDVTKHVTRQVAVLLRQTCETRVANMTQAEARGYLWAMSRPIVATAVNTVSRAYPMLGTTSLVAVRDRAHDRVVRTVLAELMHSRTRYVAHRRAA